MKKNVEQLFVLLLIGVSVLIVLCATGCGGNSCETMQCGNYKEDDGTFYGISIPGCGGCLTSGKGCGSCLWPQSCKILYGNIEYGDGKTFIAVDNRYYTNGRLGCGQTEESCYSSCLVQDIKNWGCVYGSTNSEERMIGCSSGCGGCIASDGSGQYFVDITEAATSIR